MVRRVPEKYTIDDHRRLAKTLYDEAREIRLNGLGDIESVEKVQKLEKEADGHILVLNSLVRREKKRGNITNGKA